MCLSGHIRYLELLHINTSVNTRILILKDTCISLDCLRPVFINFPNISKHQVAKETVLAIVPLCAQLLIHPCYTHP